MLLIPMEKRWNILSWFYVEQRDFHYNVKQTSICIQVPQVDMCSSDKAFYWCNSWSNFHLNGMHELVCKEILWKLSENKCHQLSLKGPLLSIKETQVNKNKMNHYGWCTIVIHIKFSKEVWLKALEETLNRIHLEAHLAIHEIKIY